MNRSTLRRAVATALLCGALGAFAPLLAAQPAITDDPLSSREGYATVNWQPGGEFERFEVEVTVADGKPWSTHDVEGTSLFLSGLTNGDYRIRVRALDEAGDAASPWSERLPLEVSHHGQNLTLSLFATGLAVVALTVGFVLATVLRVRPTPTGETS